MPMADAAGEVALSPVKLALKEIRELRAKVAQMEEAARAKEAASECPIAIVGVGLRFPGGVTDLDSLWDLLASGRDAITDVPQDRWDWRQYFDSNPDARGAMYAVRGGFLDDITSFDAEFFGISPREAASLDPQQRLLHEVAWHALEDAAIAPDALRDSNTGLFLGLSNFDYMRAVLEDDLKLDAYSASGNSASMAAGRLAYTLGVHGPAMTVDTSCSSSLTAVHLAMQSLRSGECTTALAGGVNAILSPQMHIAFSRARMLSPDGNCKTFDASADGYVRSEGCAVLVLKRLPDAVRDGDRVLAVIRASAMNHDGRSGGLTAPSGPMQAALLREAFAKAHVTVDEIGMIEAHGTGTALGDPIEMEALGEVFRGRSRGLEPVWIGSVKTNLGHMEAASGVAGLLKAVLALQHRAVPAHLHLHAKSSLIPWDDLPFAVPGECLPWGLRDGLDKRIAGVSSFGFSGTNVHVVLEEFLDEQVDTKPDARADGWTHVVAISGRNDAALIESQRAIASYLEKHSDYDLADVSATLGQGRTHHARRAAFVVSSREELLERMRAESMTTPQNVVADPLSFLFTGQGSERSGMGLDLLARNGIFRSAVDRMDAALDGALGMPIAQVWANGSGELERASLVQPALYAYGWAMSEVWRAWGVSPRVVLGHSLGEYVAAAVAGAMSPEDGIRLVAKRGRLTEELAEAGGMVAIAASEDAVLGLLRESGLDAELSIAAINGPASVVVSGRIRAIEQLENRLPLTGWICKRLRTTHGFHSAALDAMLDAFEREAERVSFRVPEMLWISNLTGKPVEAKSPVDAKYWRKHLREAVQFESGLNAALAADVSMFVEIGAQPQLLAIAESNGIGSERLVASIAKGGAEGESRKFLNAAARLYVAGASLDWKMIAGAQTYRKLRLPGYPFQRQRHWFGMVSADVDVAAAMATAVHDQAAMAPIGLEVGRLTEQKNALAQWSLALIFLTLRSLGCFNANGSGDEEQLSVAALMRDYGVSTRHERLVAKWLEDLADAGILLRSDDSPERTYKLQKEMAVESVESLWGRAEEALAGDKPLREYLASCAAKLLPVIRGEMSPLETLFPGGDDSLATGLYEHSPSAAYVNRIAAAAIAARARVRARTAMGFPRRLRVLEIGAGTGSTTAAFLPHLPVDQVLYTFSDVSEMFLNRARQRFKTHAMEFVQFSLDESDADDQIASHEGRYDVVLIANALHAAKDLRASLERIRRVLQPGGSLVLVETTELQLWHDVSTGLIEGWQHFADEARKDSALLPVDRWAEELEQAGFEGFAAAPDVAHGDARALPLQSLGLHVLLAHRTEEDTVRVGDAQASATRRRSRGGVETPELQVGTVRQPADEANATAAGKLLEEISGAAAKNRISLVVEATVIAVAQTLGRGTAKDQLPAKDARLMDIGLDSLMAIELRNRLQTIFNLGDLPSTLMFDYPTSEAVARLILVKLGYEEDGRDKLTESKWDDWSSDLMARSEASFEPRSDEELDSMSEEELADLLRLRLEQ
jgi:acyl transferase domain-containing protein/SAM-dependent methyltransferase